MTFSFWPSNSIVGTKWILTKYTKNFSSNKTNDTIYFYSSTRYSINGSGQYQYTLGSIPSSTNYTLTLWLFYPFGGSTYSGQIGYNFVSDGQINGVTFTDDQNTYKVTGWFVKIK